MHIPDHTIHKCGQCGSTGSEYFNDGRREGRRCLNPKCRHEHVFPDKTQSVGSVSYKQGADNTREF